MNENKPYLLNRRPVTAKELIAEAEHLYGCQAGKFMKLTSAAARCLRDNGHRVEEDKP